MPTANILQSFAVIEIASHLQRSPKKRRKLTFEQPSPTFANYKSLCAKGCALQTPLFDRCCWSTWQRLRGCSSANHRPGASLNPGSQALEVPAVAASLRPSTAKERRPKRTPKFQGSKCPLLIVSLNLAVKLAKHHGESNRYTEKKNSKRQSSGIICINTSCPHTPLVSSSKELWLVIKQIYK